MSQAKVLSVNKLLAGFACFLGVLVIYGWFTGNQALTNVHPSFVSMKFNTALLLLLSGAGILSLLSNHYRIALALGGVTSTLALATISQYFFQIDLGVDNLFVRDTYVEATSAPGRMGLNTAICYVLSGLAICIYSFGPHKQYAHLTMGILGSIVLALALAALAGYALAIDLAYGWGRFSAMAVHTAAGFSCIGIALLTFPWNKQDFMSINVRYSRALLPIGVLVVVLNATLGLAIQASQQRQLAEASNLRLQSVVRDIELGSDEQDRAFGRMALRIASHNAIDESDWRTDANFYLEDLPSLLLLSVLDTDLTPRWSETRDNSAPQSAYFDVVRSLPSAEIAEAVSLRQTLHRNVFSTAQVPNGILTLVPIYSLQQHLGYLLALSSAEQFLIERIQQLNASTLWFSVSSSGEAIFDSGLSEKPEDINSPVVTLTSDHFGLAWEITGGLNAQALQNAKSRLAAGVLWAIFFMSVLFVVAIHLMQRATLLRKRIELEANKAQLVVEAVPNGLLTIDSQGRIEMVNAQTERMFGYDRNELIGEPIEVLLPENLRKKHVPVRNAFFDKPEARSMGEGKNLYGRHKDGSQFPLVIGLNPTDTGNDMRVLATIINVTEREELIQELRRSNRELQEFAYVASHDLKAPLRGIDQLAGWLVEDLGEDISEDISEHLRLMRSRIERMESLLADLLSYSRVGQQQDDSETLDVKEIVQSAFNLCNNNASFKLNINGELPHIFGAKSPLHTVLRNLFSNSMKHHDKDSGNLYVSAHASKKFVEFTVADDGPGIAPEHRERVFTIFQTLRPRDEVEGSGMGLAIVKKSVELQGGSITLIDNNPRGAAFIFTWPVSK